MKKWELITIIILVLIALTGIIYYFFIRNPNFVKCGVQNCHGPIACGEIREVSECTMEFAPGDGCRHLASCKIREEKCQVVEQPGYAECLTAQGF